MKKVIVYFILLYITTKHTGETSDISSKLDFSNNESTSTNNYDSFLNRNLVKALVSLRQTTGLVKDTMSLKTDENLFNLNPLDHQKAAKQNDFTSLSVICIEGSCNTTDKNIVASSNRNKQSTDVLVQVVTDTKDVINKDTVNENNDVPIVVGRQSEATPTTYNYNHYYPATQEVRSNTQYQYQLPHLGSAISKHYFGEMPQPQYVWHRRKPMFQQHLNPYGQWHHMYPTTAHTPTGWASTTTCTCTNPALNWYPNIGTQKPSLHPSINDKMIPLV